MPISAILYDMPSQKPAIEQYCFGSCGKIIVGTIEIPTIGSLCLRKLREEI